MFIYYYLDKEIKKFNLMLTYDFPVLTLWIDSPNIKEQRDLVFTPSGLLFEGDRNVPGLNQINPSEMV